MPSTTLPGGCATLAVLLLATGAFGQDSLGFVELRATGYAGVSGRRWQLVERVRPTLEAELAERVKGVVTVEAALAQGRNEQVELARWAFANGFGPQLTAAGCCHTYRNRALHIDGAGDYLHVERLYVDYYARRLDLRIGRQAVNWGSARFFNPTDPFPEVLIAEPWRPRRGVNAARANLPLGESTDLTAVLATDDAFTTGRAAARLRHNWAQTDFALVGAWRGDSQDGFVGVDVRGTLGVGFWLEAAFFPVGERRGELSVGLDYSFPVLERLELFAQYYFNSAGAVGADLTDALLGRAGLASERSPFAPFVSGRDYLVLGVAVVATAELAGSLNALQNLNDGSGLFIPTASWGVLDWLDVALSVQVPVTLWGQGGELKPPDQVTLPTGASLDVSGLTPSAVVTLWTRGSF